MGLIISLCGVDGSGKTTIAKYLFKKMQGGHQNIKYRHEIDLFLLKSLLALTEKLFGRTNSDNLKEVVLSSTEQGKFFFSDAYYFLFWLDNLLMYISIKLKNEIVIHDRWVYDITTVFEHKKYRNKFIKFLLLNFPKSDLLFLLDVPSKVAYKRKMNTLGHENHSIKYYQEMSKSISNVIQIKGCDAIINSNKNKDEVVNEILKIISKKIKLN